MGDDASQPSLGSELRQLRAIVDDLAAQVEENTAHRRRRDRIADLLGADGDPRVPPRHARPKRECPPGWRVIPGGLAALVPVLLPGHNPALPVAGVMGRHVWLSKRAQAIVAVLALGAGVVGATPAVADDGPDRDAPAGCAQLYHCASGEGNAGPLLRGPSGNHG